MKPKIEKTKKYDITAKHVMTCGLWSKFLPDFNAGKFKSAIVIGQCLAGYYLFVDNASTEAKNAIAQVQSLIGDDGSEITGDDMKAIIEKGFIGKDHEVIVTNISGNDITGELNIVEEILGGTTRPRKAGKKGSYEDAMQEHIDEMVGLGAMDKKVGEAIIDTLRENRILEDKSLCEQLYKYWKGHWEKFGGKDPKKTAIPSPIYKDPALEEYIKDHNEGILSEGIRCALSGHGIVAQGDKSVGKNVWASTVAMLLNVPMSLLTFSRTMAPSAIYGEKSTDNTASENLFSDEARQLAKKSLSGDIDASADFEILKAQASSVRIVQDQSELFDALQYGRVMVFNEMNMADPNMFASFVNQILDGTGFLFIPGRGEVEIPREFVFIGTQNEDYEGVEQQNEATMSRLAAITFPQPKTILPQIEAAVEAAVRKNEIREINDDFRKEAGKAYAQVVKFYDVCKHYTVDDGSTDYSKLISTSVLNIRGFIRALVEFLESDGHTTLRRKIEMHVITTCPVDERTQLTDTLNATVTI